MFIGRMMAAAACLLCGLVTSAQVLTPTDVQDAQSRRLQQQYMPQLKAAGERISGLQFPYHFYLSRTLDVSERQQQTLPQASIHFDKFENRAVLEITGNYFASYSTELLNGNQRARQTFRDVMLPLLKATIPEFGSDVPFQAYALEISHHIRGKVLGVGSENVENVVVVLPRSAAERLAAADGPAAQQSALLDGEAYLNGEPITLWLSDELPAAPKPAVAFDSPHPASTAPEMAKPRVVAPLSPIPAPAEPAPTFHDASPEGLQRLQRLHQEKLAKMTAGLAGQVQFVAYAPPSFIEFRHGAYLQVSLKTNLPAASVGSQYRLAALAFDTHLAHLIRPVLAYFGDQSDFDGIDLSTTVLPGNDKAEALELIVPMAVLRCYQSYDCTGQQLINASFVLINGERVSLDLQSAETIAR
jgi:hypothetical protein